MSLTLVAFIRTDNSTFEYLKTDEFKALPNYFGVEKTRCTIWSSNIVKNLGCQILPELNEGDIYCEAEELHLLKKELLILFENIDEIMTHLNLGKDKSYLTNRLNNALNFINIAKEKGDVGIFIG